MTARQPLKKGFVIGVDVGTASVRAGLFDLKGKMIGMGEHPIEMFRPKPDYVEQSSDDIWASAGKAIRRCLRNAASHARQVIGISFDATCSLVTLDKQDRPITISPTQRAAQNVIVWMDHRATDQAGRINAAGHKVLRYVGGKLSPEQEPPKLLWIKENLPETWADAAKFFDLADFMTYRATGNDVRSLCTVVCKWTYLGHKGKHGRWDMSFFEQAGLGDLFRASRAGKTVRPMGAYAGPLHEQAARELGLFAGTAVGVGIIDAHAGGLGVLGSVYEAEPEREEGIERVLALIGGTSSCHMATTSKPVFVKGIWGPYFGAMIPGKWLLEGGQSATGALIDHIINDSAASGPLFKKAKEEGKTAYEILNGIIGKLKKSSRGAEVTKCVHVLPYFHGNRSPHADPCARGMIDGLSLDQSLEGLALRYYATVQAIAYGTRQIIESLRGKGVPIQRIHACGGGTKNAIWLQEHSDITGCPIVLPREAEAVLLGSSILAAVAAGAFASAGASMAAMSHSGRVIEPDRTTRQFHDAKYAVFRSMYDQHLKCRAAMSRFA